MYKKVTPLPKILTLVLKYKKEQREIIFDEPSIFNIYKIEQLVENKSYNELLKILNITIDNKFFNKNPNWIITWILNLIQDKKDNEIKKVNWDNIGDNKVFLFWLFDRLSERYNKDPIDLMKSYTPSQLVKVIEWINFNQNIDSKKEYKNDIYLDPAYLEQKNQEYDEILDRVYKAKEKLGIS